MGHMPHCDELFAVGLFDPVYYHAEQAVSWLFNYQGLRISPGVSLTLQSMKGQTVDNARRRLGAIMTCTRRKFLAASIGSLAASQMLDGMAIASTPAISPSSAQFPTQTVRAVPKDLSNVRGFNYTPASASGYGRPEPHYRSMWLKYNPAETEFNLDLAKRLNLNQTRAMMSYVAWSNDKDAYRSKVKHFVRACHDRGIGVMIANTYNEDPGWQKGTKESARAFAEDLVGALGSEPGLVMWDAVNEPDIKKERNLVPGTLTQMDGAKYMADTFHELDPIAPVTIGMGAVPGMEKLADVVDILQFHDYSPTRAEIRANIEEALKFARSVGKPVVDGEIGCIARANPYDVTLQEHMNAQLGWYIWELMIVPTGWGPVHGVFYKDGTVRDPSIAAALLGFFRNRSEDIVLEQPDREGRITSSISTAKDWLSNPKQDWDGGLRIAEIEANLLEAGQLTAMHELPTREVALREEL
jgi:hypothetical protein